jgi:6-phosphogluconolactonase
LLPKKVLKIDVLFDVIGEIMKILITLIISVCLFTLVRGQKNETKTYNLLVGTYSSVQNDGIFDYNFNTLTGDFELKSKLAGVENPSYLTVSHDGKHVYSVNEVRNGAISAFTFDQVSGELAFMNKVSSGGDSPCYVEIDDKDKYVFACNYGSGSLSAVLLNEDGSLGSDVQFFQHEGSGIDNSRQKGPHVHCTVLSPDNQFLLTPDLGTDKVGIYRFDAGKNSQPLTPANPSFISVKAGSGPRHITFHPNSKYAFLVHEMGGMVTAYDYKKGKLTEKQAITMLSPDFKGSVGAADIHVSPDGKFLYASNRGDANELVIYTISKKGTLKYAGRQSTLGRSPRNFAIDPTGNFLLVANQSSNEIVIFKRDIKTGLLSPTGKKIQVSKPVCLKFVVLD